MKKKIAKLIFMPDENVESEPEQQTEEVIEVEPPKKKTKSAPSTKVNSIS